MPDYSHQPKAVKFILKNDCAALFCCPRSGKTFITLRVIKKEEKKIPNYEGLIICLLSNKETTWTRRASEQLPHIPAFTDWEAYKAHRGAKLFIVHYDALRNKSLIGKLLRRPWSRVTVDESQSIRSRSSSNSRAVHRFRKYPRKLILTGEPLDGDIIDLWSQFKFVDSSRLGESFPKFTKKHLRGTGFMGYKKVVRKGHDKKVLRKIRDLCFVIEELPDLLTPDIIDVPVVLKGQSKKVYDRMESRSLVKIKGHRVIAAFEGVKQFKLHQITGGTVLDEDGNPHRLEGSKMDDTLKLIDKLSKPLVVFSRYREEIAWMEEVLKKYKVRSLHGKNRKYRSTYIDEFQSGKTDIFLVQIGAGGTGLDLYKGDVALLHSYGHSSVQFNQAMARLSVIGKKRRPKVYRVFAEGTVDTGLMGVVKEKSSQSREVLKSLRGSKKMAKKEKAAKKETKAPKTAAAKFGIKDAAEHLDTNPSALRARMRTANIEKSGKSYGWSSKTAMLEDLKKLGEAKPKKAPAKGKAPTKAGKKKSKKAKS